MTFFASRKNGGSGRADRVIRAVPPFRKIAAALIVLALAVRVIIPSGFMPSAERGFALVLCTGMDTQTVWLDKSGKLHKEDPSKGKSVEHQPCAFAGAVSAIAAPMAASVDNHVARLSTDPVPTPRAFSIGSGLAAPPPPAIGPPSAI